MEESEIKRIKDWLGTGSIIIFGMPMSGKETQVELLGKVLEAPTIGGGEILRSVELPPEVLKIMEAGDLIPNKDFFEIVLPYLQQDEFSGRPLVLSALGKREGEEQVVFDAARKSGHPIRHAFLLKIREETAIQRQADSVRGRVDDQLDILKIRFARFHEQTAPVINFYLQKDMLSEIDGELPVDEVARLLLEKLSNIARLQD